MRNQKEKICPLKHFPIEKTPHYPIHYPLRGLQHPKSSIFLYVFYNRRSPK